MENIQTNGADHVFVRYTDGAEERRSSVAASDVELTELVRQIAARPGLEERRGRRTGTTWPDRTRLGEQRSLFRPGLTGRQGRQPHREEGPAGTSSSAGTYRSQLLPASPPGLGGGVLRRACAWPYPVDVDAGSGEEGRAGVVGER